MANGFTAGGQTAAYPSNGYPFINFGGAGRAGQVGVTSQAARTATKQILPQSVTQNHMVAVLVVVFGGYILFHLSSRV
jgi:hypothetical protein